MPALVEVVQKLDVACGREFEQSVAEAFGLLNLNSQVILKTEAESDVIVEATYAENPYYVVVECCAVESHNQVSYTKLGQIRSNFTKYMDERRQRLFKNAYKLIVGRPEFSDNAKTSALPDVGLLKISTFKELLEQNSKYHFSQDELERILGVRGEIRDSHLLGNLVQPFQNKLNIYSLLFISLLESPFSYISEIRKPYTPIEQIIGEVKAYATLLRISSMTDEEIRSAIRDLVSPFPALITIRESSLRLASHPVSMLTSLGGLWVDLMQKIHLHLETFRQMQTAYPSATQ